MAGDEDCREDSQRVVDRQIRHLQVSAKTHDEKSVLGLVSIILVPKI